MTVVLVTADESGKSLFETVRQVLEPHFETVLTQKDQLKVPSGLGELLICSTADISLLECPHAIALFSAGSRTQLNEMVLQNGIAVVDSGDEKALLSAAESALPAITCGLSSRDTITLSSIGVDDAVINLQRTIKIFDGTEIEPQEFPVKLQHTIDTFALMALACIFILTGNGERLTQISI